MQGRKKWGDETRDKKNGETRCEAEKNGAMRRKTKKNGDVRRDQKNGEMRCKTKRMGKQDAR